MSYGFGDRLRENRVQTGVGAVAAIALVAAPFVLPALQTRLLSVTLIFALFATAFNLLYGYTGLLSFGHAMFVATAAYVTSKFFRFIGPQLGFDAFGGASVLATFVGALILSVVVTTLLAVVIGYFSVQLEEIYFAIITLSFSMALYVMYNQNILAKTFGGEGTVATLLDTNGSDGLTMSFGLLGEVNLFGWSWKLIDINSYFAFYFITLLLVAGGMYALWRIIRSPFGTIAKAIRENPQRARALGVDVTRHSWIVFIVSGAFSAVAGVLWCTVQTGALPDYGFWTFSANPVLMTVIGGPYSFLGPLAGAFFIEYVGFGLDVLSSSAEFLEFLVTYSGAVFGAIVVLVVLFFENGLAGGVRYAARRLGLSDRSAAETEPAD